MLDLHDTIVDQLLNPRTSFCGLNPTSRVQFQNQVISFPMCMPLVDLIMPKKTIMPTT
jgi:hypothetical protein